MKYWIVIGIIEILVIVLLFWFQYKTVAPLLNY